ncbi:hypothetical protein [Bacillus massilinigeriensis]|nr:hypothetical protein [Bacillus massilionigeriensis]
MGKKKGKEQANVEFGMEFGDVNSAKQMESVIANKFGEKNKKRKK